MNILQVVLGSIGYKFLHISGDTRFETAALKAMDGLWKARSVIGLVSYPKKNIFPLKPCYFALFFRSICVTKTNKKSPTIMLTGW